MMMCNNSFSFLIIYRLMLWYLHTHSAYLQATRKARFCGSCGWKSTREWHGAYGRLVCTNMCISQFVNTSLRNDVSLTSVS